jgi:serine phosphatase RsbU (regulator of sigma subunit)/DNA-binding response OmpR family regulator
VSETAEETVRILLVDDRHDNLVALEGILAPLGHELVFAHSGEEALRRVLVEEFALIVLDIRMPGMDGFETAARVKQRDKTADIPIIFVTAMPEDVTHAMRGFSTGAVDFLTKPFDSRLLIAKVTLFIDLYIKNRLLRRQRELLAQRLDQRYIAEARQLRKLADAALAITSALSIDDMLELITAKARDIIGAHHAETYAVLAGGVARRVSHSDKYAPTSTSVTGVDPSPLHELVNRQRRPVRMTRRDVARHSALRALEDVGSGHPVLEGWLAVPLVGPRGRFVGLVQVADKVEGDFTDNDESILVQLAQMAAVMVDKTELHNRDHLIAETLQRSLLPETLPSLPGIQLTGRYLPAAAGSEVGGDWYDAMLVDGGRIALAIGDVAGHGIGAAAVMGQLRVGMRAYAVQGLVPGAVMTALDRLIQDLSDTHLATAIYLVLDPVTCEARFVNAGHLPPLLLRPDGKSEFLKDGVTLPLGVLASVEHAEHAVTLEPDSTLLLYTDGLVEERTEPLEDRLHMLQSVVETIPVNSEVETLCDRTIEVMGAADKDDDVAMLAVHLPADGGRPG